MKHGIVMATSLPILASNYGKKGFGTQVKICKTIQVSLDGHQLF